MAKIRFSTGQVVNFDGDPTEEDVLAVARELGIDQKEPEKEEKKESFLDRVTESKISKGIQSFFPGKKLGEALGTSLAATKPLLSGDIEGFRNIISTQVPATQVGADVASAALMAGGAALPVAKGATALATVGKTALQGAGMGAAQSGTRTIAEGGTARETVRNTIIGGAIGGAVSGAVSGLGELLRASGSKIMETVIKPTQADYADGFDIKTVQKYGLGGSLTTMQKKTESKMSELSVQLAEKLKADPDAVVNLNDAYDDAVKALSKGKLRSFGSNTSTGKALEQLKEEIADIGNGIVPVTDAQIVKQSSGRMGKWLYGMTDPDSTARQTVYNAFYRAMKERIEKASPAGVREINKQLQELIPVSDAIIRRIPVANRNNLLSLQDMVTLTASAMDPRALGGFALSLAQKSGAVGNLLSKIGRGITPAAPIAGQSAAQAVPSLLPRSPEGQEEISQLPTAYPQQSTFSPEVQRIINMRQ